MFVFYTYNVCSVNISDIKFVVNLNQQCFILNHCTKLHLMAP